MALRSLSENPPGGAVHRRIPTGEPVPAQAEAPPADLFLGQSRVKSALQNFLLAAGMTATTTGAVKAAALASPLPEHPVHSRTEWFRPAASPALPDDVCSLEPVNPVTGGGPPTQPTLTVGVTFKDVFVLSPSLEYALHLFATQADGHLKEKELLRQLEQAQSRGQLGDKLTIRLAFMGEDGTLGETQSFEAVHQGHGYEWDPALVMKLPRARGKLLAWAELNEVESPVARLEQALRVRNIDAETVRGISQAISQSTLTLQQQALSKPPTAPVETPVFSDPVDPLAPVSPTAPVPKTGARLMQQAVDILSSALVPTQIANQLLGHVIEALKATGLRKQIEAAGRYVTPSSRGSVAFPDTLTGASPAQLEIRLDTENMDKFRCALEDKLRERSKVLADAYGRLRSPREKVSLQLDVLKVVAPDFPRQIPLNLFPEFVASIGSTSGNSAQKLEHIDGFWTPVGKRAEAPYGFETQVTPEWVGGLRAIRLGRLNPQNLTTEYVDYLRTPEGWVAMTDSR